MSRLAVLGLGRAATAWYVAELHRRYAAGKSGWPACPHVLLQLDFNTINPHLPDGYAALTPVLTDAIADLERLQPHSVLVPNITLHAALDRLPDPTFAWLHPMKLMTKALQAESAFVLGTRHTWGQGYIPEGLRAAGIEPLEPDARMVALSDALRLDMDTRTATDRQIQAWALEVVKLGAAAPVVLACTELSMAAATLHLENVVDLADLQLNAALEVVQSH